jgi:hypothetical protein
MTTLLVGSRGPFRGSLTVSPSNPPHVPSYRSLVLAVDQVTCVPSHTDHTRLARILPWIHNGTRTSCRQWNLKPSLQYDTTAVGPASWQPWIIPWITHGPADQCPTATRPIAQQSGARRGPTCVPSHTDHTRLAADPSTDPQWQSATPRGKQATEVITPLATSSNRRARLAPVSLGRCPRNTLMSAEWHVSSMDNDHSLMSFATRFSPDKHPKMSISQYAPRCCWMP